MIYPTSVVAIFCEDIREEAGGTFTLVGIMPDNINLPGFSAHPPGTTTAIPKLGIFLRLNFDLETQIESVRSTLVTPDGSTQELDIMQQSLIEKAREQARANGGRIAGVISKIQTSPFIVTHLGRLEVRMEIGGQTYLCGSLNFVDQKQPNTD